MTPIQLKCARILLNLTQQELAEAAKVGRATVHRWESGFEVGEGQLLLLRIAVEAKGVVLIQDGTPVDGVPTANGVALRRVERPEPEAPKRKQVATRRQATG